MIIKETSPGASLKAIRERYQKVVDLAKHFGFTPLSRASDYTPLEILITNCSKGPIIGSVSDRKRCARCFRCGDMTKPKLTCSTNPPKAEQTEA